jgi:hypothetical protein
MPATSAKQERFMQAVAHNPKFAKKAGVPQSVGREFTKKEGGPVKESKAMMGKELSFMKKKGAPKSMIKHEAAEMGAMKKGIKPRKFNEGGDVREGEHSGIDDETRSRARNFARGELQEPSNPSPSKPSVRKAAPKKRVTGGGAASTEPDVPPQYRRDPPTLGNRDKVAKYARGGGIERKGKTRGKMC